MCKKYINPITKNSIIPPFPDNLQKIVFGMGCFWGAEKFFWQKQGVYTTFVGYAGGTTSKPNYEEICKGNTNHVEVVTVVFNPLIISCQNLLRQFWQAHNPTQGMRQGNDIGTQYQSVIFTQNEEQLKLALKTKSEYQKKLTSNGFEKITTQIKIENKFNYAEDYHQQYLFKNPNGYCGLAGTGVKF